jgi:hypothetical protein
MTNGGGTTVRVKPVVLVTEPLLTFTDSDCVATCNGIPDSRPAAVSVRLSGSVPPISSQLYVPVPPVAARETSYGTPTVACGSAALVVITTGGVTGTTAFSSPPQPERATTSATTSALRQTARRRRIAALDLTIRRGCSSSRPRSR